MFSSVSRSVVKFASFLSLENLGTLLAAASLLVLPSAVWGVTTAHFSYVATVLPTNGLVWPNAVAVDAAGDVFITDQNTGSISELVAGATTLVVIHTGLTAPEGIAVDSTGNLYVSQQGSPSLTVYPAGGGAPTTLGSGLDQPVGLVLDGLGNIYVADSQSHRVKKIAISNGAVTLVGTGWSTPFGVALDAAGDLYVADPGTYSVVKVATNSVQSTVMYPLYSYGAAVDPSGNLFSSDSYGNTVQEVPLGGSQETLVSSTAHIDGTPISQPEGMAVDSTGSVYVADLNNARVIKLQTTVGTFAPTAVSTTSSIVTLTFTFGTAGLIGVPSVLTQGVSGLDFANAGTGTCTTNGTTHSYNPGDSCTVDVTFTPKYPGTRFGAAVLKDSSGNALATGYVTGTGVAALATFSPATASVAIVGSAFENPTGMALDAAGNFYVADTWHDRLVKETLSAGTYTASTIFQGVGRVYGGGIDGAGNVYTADCTTYQILKLPWNGSSYGTPVDIADWTSTNVVWCPTDIVADAQGNLFVTDYYQTYIYEIPFSAGVYGAPIHIGSGMNKPYAVAVDSDHNLYVADWGNNRVVEEHWTGTAYGAQIVLASGMGGPDGVALDNRGNIYVANYNTSTVEVLPKAGNGFGALTTFPSFGNYVNGPEGLALDGSGNIFLMNYTNGNVVKLAVSGPPALTFATPTTLGSVDAVDGAKSATVENIGNADLIFTASGLTAPVDFLQTAGSGTPVDCANSATVAAGASCNLSIDFHPTAAGTFTESFVLANNSLNISPATQSIGLSGTGAALGDTTATAVTVSPSAIYSGQTVTVTATVADSTNGSATPTGSVTFTDAVGSTTTSLNSGNPVSMASGVAALSSVTLSGVGTHTITASYAGVVGSFASSSNTAAISMTATPTATVTPPAALNMGQVPVGQASSAQALTFTIATTGLLGNSQVFTLGAFGKGYPFVLTSPSSCNPMTLTQVFAAGSTCTELVKFEPVYPGVQYGAVELRDQSNNLLATAYMYATGTGPEAATLPGTPTSVTATGSFMSTYALAFDGYGRLSFADFSGNHVYRVSQYGGATVLIAGNGTQGGSGDSGLAINAALSHPSDVAFDGAGNLFIADYGNNRVRMVSAATGKITAYAGTGASGWTGDGGQATSATMNSPTGLAFDGSGNLYIADQLNHVIRKVTVATGVITTVAGNGTPGSGGDSGLATQAQLNGPNSVAVDGAGNLYIADKNNNRVRMVSASSGNMSTVAGNGTSTDSGDGGLATQAGISHPVAVAVDAAGNLAIVDNGSTIRMVFAASGIIHTDSVSVGSPVALREDGAGNLYAADTVAGGLYIVSPTKSFTYPTATAVGSLDAMDGPQTALLLNIGNTALTAVAPGLTAPVDFVQVAGSGTPADCAATFSTAAGAACTLNLEFEPTALGSLTESYSITDNSLNRSSTTQSIGLQGTALPGQATLTVTGVPNTAQPYATTFTVGSSGGSGSGAVTFNASGACSVSATTVTITAGSGTCSVTASKATDGTYAAATSAAASVAASLATEVTLAITGVPNTPQPYGTTFTVVSSGGSGNGAVTFNASGACSVTGANVTITAGSGTCSVTATKASDGTYAAATSAAASVAASLAAEATLTVTGFPNTAQQSGTTFTVGSSGGSGSGAVTFNVTGSCSVSGTTVTMTAGSGTCSVTASKASDGHYAAATSAPATVSAALSQIITFAPLTSPVEYTAPIPLTATGGSSGNPVTFSIVSGPGAISGNTLILTGAGTVVVAANQAANANYAAASQVTQSVISVAANLVFNIASMAFGSVPLGTTSPAQTLIVSNPNVFAATGTSISASGDFSAASNCPAIAPLTTCSVNITFTPSVAGTRTGNLTVIDAQMTGQLSASLTGAGTAPGIQFSTPALDFGSVVNTASSYGQTITIQNTGTAALVISNIATTGDFATTGNCAIIPAGSNCSLTVIFTPSSTGARTGTVTLTDNVGGANQSQVVNLSGIGTQPGVALTPSVETFSSTLVGSTGFLLNATLTNTGTAPLTGIGVSIQGNFTQTNTCHSTLAPAATCTVSLTYAPTIAGAESGTLTVATSLGPQTVSLVGTGVMPGASLSSSQLLFGGQLIDTTSLAQTVVFINTGTTAINIGSVATTSHFTNTTNCSGSIAAGASCSVNVVFTPSTAGPLSGTVTITDGAGTQTASLAGQGVSPGLAVSPSFEIFGAQVAGTTSQAQTLTVTNTGKVALTLNPITVSNNFIEFDQCPATFQPGATCSVSLSFAPTSTGTLSGSLVIGDAGGLASTLVTSTGQGTLPGIATSPSMLSFGSLAVGTASQGQTVTVTNTGTAPLLIGTVSGTGDFAETDTCSSQTVAPSAYCVISVTMTPTTVGTRTGTIQFNDSVDGLHQIALSGVGQQGGVSVSPTSLAFGSAPIVSSAQAPSTPGTSLSITIRNTGSAPLMLGGLSTQGDFSESGNCGSAVAVGATCTLTVKFVPTALGHRTGTLTITDNAGGGSQTVSLAGDGGPAGLILTPPVIDFGVQPKSVTSTAHIATLSNNTGQAITDLLILASGEYSEADSCGTVLANGASCTLNITVTPATAGAVTGTVVISGGGVFANTATPVKTRGESVAHAAASSSSNVGVVATLADTNGNANAKASELAFGAAPTPVINAGGNAGSFITVLENDSNGNAVGATDTITLAVNSPGGAPKTYAAPASGGIATFNLSGNPLTAAGVYSYTATVATNAAIKAATASETINAGAAASVTAIAGSGQSAATNLAFGTPLQVLIKDSYGNPVSGVIVTFAAPTAGASVTLSSNSVKTGAAGAANVTATANGIAGAFAVTAAAAGATSASFSLTNSQVQSSVDFSLSPGNVNGQGPSQTVIPGATATYSLTIVPTSGTTLPASTTLTVTGMPAGATASVPTSPWTRSAGNLWSFPANTSFTGFALSIQLPSATALLDHRDAPARKFPPVLWGILLLPFAGGMRRRSKRLGKAASIFMVMVLGLTAAVALGGCGSSNGFFGQPQKTYTVTVTATSGTLSHSTNLTLTVE
jgi:sugar lactone lactonase YvrE